MKDGVAAVHAAAQKVLGSTGARGVRIPALPDVSWGEFARGTRYQNVLDTKFGSWRQRMVKVGLLDPDA